MTARWATHASPLRQSLDVFQERFGVGWGSVEAGRSAKVRPVEYRPVARRSSRMRTLL
jgi:hypothetical protein